MPTPTCLECERIRRGLDERPPGEHACTSCGDVWCIVPAVEIDGLVFEPVRERLGPDARKIT